MHSARRTVTLPWGEVSVVEWRPAGPADASVVVLLHGGGLDSAWLSWGGVGSSLAEAGHRVLAPDLPGYGESPRAPWAASQQALLACVEQVVEALGLERYALGGLSMGGGLSIGHALAHPERVRGLMLLGSYGLAPTLVEGWWAAPAQLLAWAATRAGVLPVVTRATTRTPAAVERSLRPVLRSAAQRTPELVGAVHEAARAGTSIDVFGEWQRSEVGARRQTTAYDDRLGELAMPALVVHGALDAGVPAAVARRAAAAMPDAELLVVPHAAHWVQRDRPEVVVPAMRAFLDRLP
jgi:pimeloyl-ACP methyl ester carboxylesterase